MSLTPGWALQASRILHWLQIHPGPHEGLEAREIASRAGLTPRQVGQVLGRLEALQIARRPRIGRGNGLNTWDLQLHQPGKHSRPPRTQEPHGNGHR